MEYADSDVSENFTVGLGAVKSQFHFDTYIGYVCDDGSIYPVCFLLSYSKDAGLRVENQFSQEYKYYICNGRNVISEYTAYDYLPFMDIDYRQAIEEYLRQFLDSHSEISEIRMLCTFWR